MALFVAFAQFACILSRRSEFWASQEALETIWDPSPFIFDLVANRGKKRIRDGCLAAADKVDDFEAIVGLHLGFFPAGAREDVEVAFEGDAVERHAEVLDHRRDVQTVRNFACAPR